MRHNIKEWTTWIAILTLSICLIVMIFTLDNARQTNEAKIELMQEQIEEANTKAITMSDIEELEFYAKENARYTKLRLEDISGHKAEIEKLQSLYENELLSQRCFESQIDRKINWLEYNIEYCKDETNLEQFRPKKY